MGQHVTIHGKTTESFNGQDGKWIPIRVDASGNLATTGGTQYAEGAASSGTDTGIIALAVRRDTASAGGAADGDFATLSVDNTGALRVTGGEVSYELQTAVDAAGISIDNASLTTVFALDVTGWKKASIYF